MYKLQSIINYVILIYRVHVFFYMYVLMNVRVLDLVHAFFLFIEFIIEQFFCNFYFQKKN